MTLDELVAEGDALVRPCFVLSEDRGHRLAAYWGGERKDMPNAIPPAATAVTSQALILTLDSALFSELGLPHPSRPISLFATEYTDGRQLFRAQQGASKTLADIACTGRPLFAVAAQSFPPLEAVCLYGGPAVENWLSSLGLERHQYEAAFGQNVAEAYMDEFFRRSPFHTTGADVIVGGWHMMWPDDEFYMPREMRLLATTIRDSEPFLEIWVSERRNLSVTSRIT